MISIPRTLRRGERRVGQGRGWEGRGEEKRGEEQNLLCTLTTEGEILITGTGTSFEDLKQDVWGFLYEKLSFKPQSSGVCLQP